MEARNVVSDRMFPREKRGNRGSQPNAGAMSLRASTSRRLTCLSHQKASVLKPQAIRCDSLELAAFTKSFLYPNIPGPIFAHRKTNQMTSRKASGSISHIAGY